MYKNKTHHHKDFLPISFVHFPWPPPLPNQPELTASKKLPAPAARRADCDDRSFLRPPVTGDAERPLSPPSAGAAMEAAVRRLAPAAAGAPALRTPEAALWRREDPEVDLGTGTRGILSGLEAESICQIRLRRS